MDKLEYKKIILDFFSRYMSDLAECAEKLRQIVARGFEMSEEDGYKCLATHQDMIDVLKAAAEGLSKDSENLKQTVQEYKVANPKKKDSTDNWNKSGKRALSSEEEPLFTMKTDQDKIPSESSKQFGAVDENYIPSYLETATTDSSISSPFKRSRHDSLSESV